ncbi:MAG: gephyrin-like molybdotransferase Glp [Myxococcota bacterium]
MLEVEQALEIVLTGLAALSTETVALAEASGRVLAEPLDALREQPAYANSAMDGYAIRYQDVEGTPGPARLTVVGESPAGSRERLTVTRGEAVRIFTGGPLPRGADTVVIQENTSNNETSLTVNAVPSLGENVRGRGDDTKHGQRLIEAGVRLGPGEIANLALQGVTRPCVYRRPVVGLLSSGNELIVAGPKPDFGQVTNASSPMLAACVQSFGGVARATHPIPDDLAAIRTALVEAAQHTDLVVITGGMSVGDYDFAARAMREEGTIDFHRVRMKPGKPLAFGTIQGTPMLGLPGNPVSSFVGFELFARPAILTLAGRVDIHRRRHRLRLTRSVRRNRSRPEYLRGMIRDDGFEPHLRQGSNDLSSVLGIDGLGILPAGDDEANAGSTLDVIDLRIDGAAF